MGRAIAMREDYDGPVLRRLAKMSKDAGQVRRFLSLAEIYDGSNARRLPGLEVLGFRLFATGFYDLTLVDRTA